MSKVLNAVKGILGAVAPTLATSLGGPLAGTAVTAISHALLGKDANEPEIIDYILANNNPEMLAKLKQAELDFERSMKELDIEVQRLAVEEDRVAVDDRKSARSMQISTNGRAPGFLALAIILMFGANIVALFRHEIPTESAPVLFMLTGALAAGLTQVLNFYFGSSKSSKEKDTSLSDLTAALAAARVENTALSKGTQNG